MIDPANKFLCLKSENFLKLWLTRTESGFSENWLAFHIFKNRRLFDQKNVAGLEMPKWHKYEPRSEKTGLRGFQPGLTQTRLYSYRR